MTLADAPPSLDQASASPSEEPPHDRDEPETRQLSHVDPLFASDIHSGHDFSDRDDKRKNGRPVELVREVDDGARSSMARRRKSDKPDMMHVCRNCKKEFKRPCDLIKHEKTHSRPWKCTEEKCKYYGLGWPTEKERDRHVNDKHSSAPPQYKCLYSPCTYSSKRESNCKQHMEKAHGWEYVRSKSNGRSSKPSSATYTFSSASPSTTITPFGNFDFAHVPLSSPALSFDLDEAFAAGGFSIFDSEDIFLKNNHLETAMAASLESSGPISDALVIDPVLAPPEDVEATMSAFTSIADKSGGAAPTIMAQEMSCGVVPCISEHIGFSTASEHTSKPNYVPQNESEPSAPDEKKKKSKRPISSDDKQTAQENSPPKKIKKSSPKRDKRRLMSCIFRKFKPDTYNFGTAKYKTCHTTSHEYVSTLIRHLERYHNAVLCHNCLAKFPSQEDKAQHKTAKQCEPAGGSQEHKWQILYTKLCGDGLKHSPVFESNLRQTNELLTQQIQPDLGIYGHDEEIDSRNTDENKQNSLSSQIPKQTTSLSPAFQSQTSESKQQPPPFHLSSNERRDLELLREENNRLLRENNILLRRLLQWESVCSIPELSGYDIVKPTLFSGDNPIDPQISSRTSSKCSQKDYTMGMNVASFSDSGIGTDVGSVSSGSPMRVGGSRENSVG